jgi:hypothetical protein
MSRMVVGFEGSPWSRRLIFSRGFGVSVGVAVFFSGTCLVLAVLFLLNLDFR